MIKKELRTQMRTRNCAITAAERAEASRRIFDRVGSLAAFDEAQTVGLYCALADEPDTTEVLVRWSSEKRVVVPRVEGSVMQFYEYDPLTLCRGAFGIDEPGEEALLCDPAQIDLVIVPGMAFAAAGTRCGRGRGYYDKYLSQPGMQAAKVGVCFAHQLVEELPVEPHDVLMDEVITD